MKFERLTWQIDDEEHQLVHAPWNPRAEITPESVKDLTASITAKGLLHDIGVWIDPKSGNAYVIFGNRRFVACREAGLTEIPCKLYHCSEAEARELTRIENEQRLGVSAIEDAKLVKSMLDLGFKETEIAAHFGVSNAMVCRRAKLIGLNERYVKVSGSFTTDALEQIAMFPDDVQERMYDRVKSFMRFGTVKWSDVRSGFQNEIRNLPSAPFLNVNGEANNPDVESAAWKKCVNCAKRTGCQADLFGEITAGKDDGGGIGSLGHCLDAKCYAAMTDEWIERELDRRIPSACTERVRITSYWQWKDEWEKRHSKKNPCAYWRFDEYTNKIDVAFGPSAKAEEERREEEWKREEEEREQNRIARQREYYVLKVCEDWAASGIGDEDDDNGEDYLREGLEYLWQLLEGVELVKEALRTVFQFDLYFGDDPDMGISEVCEYGDRTDQVRQLFLHAKRKDVEKVVDIFLRLWGSSLRNRIGNRFDEDRVSNAYCAACMFKSLREKLTDEQFDYLKDRHLKFIGEKK